MLALYPFWNLSSPKLFMLNLNKSNDFFFILLIHPLNNSIFCSLASKIIFLSSISESRGKYKIEISVAFKSKSVKLVPFCSSADSCDQSKRVYMTMYCSEVCPQYLAECYWLKPNQLIWFFKRQIFALNVWMITPSSPDFTGIMMWTYLPVSSRGDLHKLLSICCILFNTLISSTVYQLTLLFHHFFMLVSCTALWNFI